MRAGEYEDKTNERVQRKLPGSLAYAARNIFSRRSLAGFDGWTWGRCNARCGAIETPAWARFDDVETYSAKDLHTASGRGDALRARDQPWPSHQSMSAAEARIAALPTNRTYPCSHIYIRVTGPSAVNGHARVISAFASKFVHTIPLIPAIQYNGEP